MIELCLRAILWTLALPWFVSQMETNKVTSDWFILELSTGQFQLEIAIGRMGDE